MIHNAKSVIMIIYLLTINEVIDIPQNPVKRYEYLHPDN